MVPVNPELTEVGVSGLTSETTWRLSKTCGERLSLPYLPFFPRPRPVLPPRLLDPSFGGFATLRRVSCVFPVVVVESRGTGPSRYKAFTTSTFSAERNCSRVAVNAVGHSSFVVVAAGSGSSFTGSFSELTTGRPMDVKRVTVWLRSTSKTKKSVKLIKERQTLNEIQNPGTHTPLLNDTLYHRESLPNVLGYPNIGFTRSMHNAIWGSLRYRW
jgi:hypothetical protein